MRDAAALLLGGALATAALAAGEGTQRPEARTGPFRVVVDRISESRTTVLTYRTAPGRREDGGAQSRRTLQLQVQVLADNPGAAAGLASFQVNGLSAESGRRLLGLPHSGGILETPDDKAVVRAYLYVPACPPLASEVRAMEGEIVAYEKAGDSEIEVPLTGKTPSSAQKDGIRATVQATTHQGTNSQLTLELTAPDGTMLVNPANDGTYGVSLVSAGSRPAPPTGGSMSQPRPNAALYRLGFQNVQGPPLAVRVRFVYRGGARRVYPFRVEHIPIPTRPAARPPAAPGNEQEQH